MRQGRFHDAALLYGRKSPRPLPKRRPNRVTPPPSIPSKLTSCGLSDLRVPGTARGWRAAGVSQRGGQTGVPVLGEKSRHKASRRVPRCASFCLRQCRIRLGQSAYPVTGDVPPTVLCPLGWTVACTTRQGQSMRPAAPSAPDRRPRLVPASPLEGGCCVRGYRLYREEAPRGLRTLQRAVVSTPTYAFKRTSS
jgi:hypothetical protein